MKTSWVWPTSSFAALLPGKTYVLGGNLTSTNGYTEYNVSFTYSSSCAATTTCGSPCTSSPYNAPANNKGWRYVFTQINNLSAELPLNPAVNMTVFTGPTIFGLSRAPKISLYFDFVDVCNCIWVNWVGWITQDDNTTNSYKAHYWNSGVGKRSNDEVDLPRSSSRKRCNSVSCGPPPDGLPGSYRSGSCCTNTNPNPPPVRSQKLPAGYGATLNSNYNSGNPDKRQNLNNGFWLYYVFLNQTACLGLPNIGSYGKGANGVGVYTWPSLGVSYL